MVQDYGFLKIFFIVLCALVIFQELYVFFILKPTLTKSVKSSIEKDDFPEILICPEPSSYGEQLVKHGYNEMYSYAVGQN